MLNKDLELLLAEVGVEVEKAVERYPAMNSPHEGFSVLAEEVDELWDEVKVKQGRRDVERMRKEAIQIAAMAVRFIYDLCNPQAGQK